MTRPIALIVFLILLIQLSVKFLEVTFLDITGEGAVVVLLKIIGFLLLLGLLYLLFKWLSGKGSGGIAVVPFEDRATSKSNGENSNKSNELGRSVTDLFVADLDQINQLCLLAKPQKNISSGVSSPSITVQQEDWSTSGIDIFKISPVKLGPIELELSVGKLLIFLKKIWPFGGVETVINGSIQHWDTKNSLIVQLNSPLKFELLQVDFDCNDSSMIFKKVKELAYQVAYEIAPDKFLAQTWQEFVYKLGNIYFGLEKYKKALSLYDESSQYDPNLWQPYHNTGVICLYSDQQDLIDYNEAIKQFNKALKNFPESSASYSGLGLAYFFKAALSNFHCGLLTEAEKWINKAIELDSTNASYYWNRSLIKFSQNNFADAEQAWNNAIQIIQIQIQAQVQRQGHTTEEENQKNKLCIYIYNYARNSELEARPNCLTQIKDLLKTRDFSKQKGFLKFIVQDLRMLKKITNTADFDSLIQALQEAIEKPMVQRNLLQQAWRWLSEKFQQAWAWLSEKFQSFPPSYKILLAIESLIILILLLAIIYCVSK